MIRNAMLLIFFAGVGAILARILNIWIPDPWPVIIAASIVLPIYWWQIDAVGDYRAMRARHEAHMAKAFAKRRPEL